jgi:chromosome segregation ATPase
MLKRATTILLLAMVAVAFSGIAAAQDNGPSKSHGSTTQQKTQQMMQQYRQKAMQLQQIHQKTMANNPQLTTEQNQFKKQVRQAIAKQGYDIDKGQKRLQTLAQKLQSGKLKAGERKATIKEFQAERQRLIKARDAALKQPKIQKSGKQLEQHTITAMKKQDGRTGPLLNDMQMLRHRLRSTMAKQSVHKD